MVVCVIATVFVNRRFIKRINGKSVTEPQLLTAFAIAKSILNINAEIPLLDSSAVSSPSLFGLISPKLLIPSVILRYFNSEELNHVFIHEMVHFKRKDLLVRWLTQGLLILNWFNPIFWFAFYKLREDQEIACDAATLRHLNVNDPREYACTLVKLAENTMAAPKITGLASLLASRSQLKRRVNMIKSIPTASIKWSLLVVGLVAVLSLATLSNAKATVSTKDIPAVTITHNNSIGSSQSAQIQPNEFKSNEGWILRVTKVVPLGAGQGQKWS